LKANLAAVPRGDESEQGAEDRVDRGDSKNKADAERQAHDTSLAGFRLPSPAAKRRRLRRLTE